MLMKVKIILYLLHMFFKNILDILIVSEIHVNIRNDTSFLTTRISVRLSVLFSQRYALKPVPAVIFIQFKVTKCGKYR